VPDVIPKLAKLGFSVIVQSGAGRAASIGDDAYARRAHDRPDRGRVWRGADIVFKVRAPTREEVRGCARAGPGELHLAGAEPELLQALAAKKVTVLAMDSVPRISRAQKLDALSSMANIGGYRAVIEAAHEFGAFFTGQITAAGKVPPAKVFVIGAGVPGSPPSAAARAWAPSCAPTTRARGRGPDPVARRRVRPRRLRRGRHGRGRLRQGDERGFQKAQRETFAAQAKEVDIIITTALIPGKPAPKLITAEMVRSMKPAASSSTWPPSRAATASCTEPGKVVVKHGVTIIGYTDLPSRLATQASTLYATNLFRLSEDLTKAKDGVSTSTWRTR
jgi:NAD(P) transhydrogenase subunit alpha